MNANFCDRCGKHIPGYAEDYKEECGGKYRIQMIYNPEVQHRGSRFISSLGRGLIFCKDCQAAIDKLIDEECRIHLPKNLVADTETVKKHDEEES